MRIKIVNADGGFQYKQIHKLVPELQFAIMPRIKFNAFEGLATNTLVEVRRRRFEYRDRNENGIPVYMEVVE